MATGLGAHHRHVHMVAGIRRGFDANALLQAILTQVSPPGPGADGYMNLGTLRRDAHLFRPVIDQRTDVGAVEIVGPYDFLVGLVNHLFAIGDFHLEDVRRVKQAAGVILQPENRGAATGIVGTNPFKNAHAVVQRMGEYMRIGIAPGNQLAIQPDKTVAVRHRHDVNPS